MSCPVSPVAGDLGTWSSMPAPGTTGESPAAFVSRRGVRVPKLGIGDDWFDRLQIVPQLIDMGEVNAPVEREVRTINAYRTETHNVSVSVTAPGVSISAEDDTSDTLRPQEILTVTLLADPVGGPIIDGRFDATSPTADDVWVPVVGRRGALMPFEPEAPVTERLEFLTDLMRHLNDTEQRVALRQAPRQVFQMSFFREDGLERQRLQNLLFDRLGQQILLPIWTEPAYVSEALPRNTTAIPVDTTNYADFRADGGVMLIDEEDNHWAAGVESVSETEIVLTSPTDRVWRAGTRVLPLRTAVVVEAATDARRPVNASISTLTARVTEPPVSLSDVSAWTMLDGAPVVDDPNAIQGQTFDSRMQRLTHVADPGTGGFRVVPMSDRARPSSNKTWITRTRDYLWRVRQFLHYVRGRQQPFWLPTFARDLTLATDYPSGSTTLGVVSTGYARFVQARSPRAYVRIVLTDGTKFMRRIVAAADGSDRCDDYPPPPGIEFLHMDSGIAQSFTMDEVRRIEFLEYIRLDSDSVQISHRDSDGSATIGVPVRSVLDEESVP